jgi:hypothetical protein
VGEVKAKNYFIRKRRRSQLLDSFHSNEESGGKGEAAYAPGVVGMERGQEKGTGGR